jgi:hypothetical protein
MASADSLYCPYCSLSLGCTVCEHGHRCPLGVNCCHRCGSIHLSEGTRAVRLSFVGSLAAGAAALLLWKFCLAHLWGVLAAVGTGGIWAAAVLTNGSVPGVRLALGNAFALCLVLWLLGHFLALLPGGGGPAGAFLRGLPAFLGRRLGRAALRGAALAARALGAAFFGGPGGGGHGSAAGVLRDGETGGSQKPRLR